MCQKLLDERVDEASAFQWQSQLRYGVHEKTGKLLINVCDADIDYMYEYIGSPGCLVITPLTDRCVITLTQAQRLVLGGAPAGPAGTGKTETVKDLGRALGIQVYVFNCSDQMDYKAMGMTYKGLAQTGAWGCFDEFNRIPIDVLSVVAGQYGSVLDAIRGLHAILRRPDRCSAHCRALHHHEPGVPRASGVTGIFKSAFPPGFHVRPGFADDLRKHADGRGVLHVQNPGQEVCYSLQALRGFTFQGAALRLEAKVRPWSFHHMPPP